ncbi:MAG: GTP cyclohydrolase I FolE2 [Desulfurococcales archaeon]|nr:GTP cyclohydrolase I FolE2 [Desulfurococcales archaeon]
MEIQDEKPRVSIPLDCIGFKGIRRKLRINSVLEGLILLDSSIDVCVSIDGDRRGAHLSRNLSAVSEAITSVSSAHSIEEYLGRIAKNLINLHSYARRAVVRARTTYYVAIEHEGIMQEEPVEVEVEVEVSRDGEEYWSTSVTVYGMTACPSAQKTINELRLGEMRGVTHSQKAKLRVTVRSPPGNIARIEELAKAAAKSFSAPAFSMLKRDMEANLVISAHLNPKFAEDVVRDAILNVASMLRARGFDENTLITAEIESYESIHPQNVYARASLTLKDIDRIR